MAPSNQKSSMCHMLKCKIHRATVTDANLDYEGSITIDVDLVERAKLLPNEKVSIYNITNGERFSTYVILGERHAGDICLNGAAAHKVNKGDLVIIAAYSWMDEALAKAHEPIVVKVDAKNKAIVEHKIQAA